MDTIALFKQAALALQQDEIYLQLAKARQINDEDDELQDMIGQFNLARLALNSETEKENKSEEKIKDLNEEISQLYSGIMANQSMVLYNRAKQNIKGLVSHIHSIVAAAVDGEDPGAVQEPSQGCGGGACSSCSGCSCG